MTHDGEACGEARAHPRSRGENATREYASACQLGSSPLTRGKSVQHLHSRAGHGLIPAHAGKIGRKAAAGLSCRAHPRSRGENHPLDGDKIARPGSSPLTRGKLETCVTEATELGLIPAHAGKINAGLEGGDHLGAHPRSRGENDGFVGRHGGGSGSSPLTRGKCRHGCSTRSTLGLIPAHAGKMPSWLFDSFHARAHPRSRGENGAVLIEERPQMGSSPLTRGK